MAIKSVLIDEIGFSKLEIDHLSQNCHELVRLIKIPKKKGGFRKVFHPSRKLKAVQHWLKQKYFDEMPPHEASTAYFKGNSILKNAQRHKDSNHFIKIDFESFFECITYFDVEQELTKRLSDKGLRVNEVNEVLELTKNFCFGSSNSLVMGYPTSPCLANLAMFDFDMLMTTGLREISSDIIYTRYADDIIVSYSNKDTKVAIKECIGNTVKSSRTPNLKVNKNKTMLFTKKSGIAAVTGVRIAADGHLTIHRRTKDQIRLLLALMKKKDISTEDRQKLQGLILFARSVDPHFYTKIYRKYFHQMSQLQD